MPKLNVQQNNANIIKALRNALAIGQIKGPIASDGNDNFSSSGSNPNLLDNAYFVGGGSQLGDGVFPVNQRGLTSYTSAGFVFDRWFKSGGVTATLDAGGLTIANSNGWPDGINQRFPMHFFAQMNGEAITASVLYADGSVDSGTAVIDATQNYQWLKYPEAGEIGFQLKNFQDGAAYDYFDYISFGAGTNSTPKKIKAFKLEKGTISTIKNDPVPDFGEELRKCLRYLYIMGGAPYTMFGSGIAESGSYIMATVQFPVPMRATPTLSTSGAFRMWGGVGYEFNVSGIAISSYIQIPTNCPYAGISCSTSGSLTIGNIYYLQSNSDTNAKLTFSAEL